MSAAFHRCRRPRYTFCASCSTPVWLDRCQGATTCRGDLRLCAIKWQTIGTMLFLFCFLFFFCWSQAHHCVCSPTASSSSLLSFLLPSPAILPPPPPAARPPASFQMSIFQFFYWPTYFSQRIVVKHFLLIFCPHKKGYTSFFLLCFQCFDFSLSCHNHESTHVYAWDCSHIEKTSHLPHTVTHTHILGNNLVVHTGWLMCLWAHANRGLVKSCHCSSRQSLTLLLTLRGWVSLRW